MELELKRIAKRDTYTIGHLYVDGVRYKDTMEDTDRGLDQKMSLAVLKARKRKGITAIPTGRYRVTLGVKSPKYSKRPQYDFCEGYVPRLINVPAYDGILIHIGNYPQDTEGCILVGRNTKVGAVLQSTETFKKLYATLKKSTENIYITIK